MHTRLAGERAEKASLAQRSGHFLPGSWGAPWVLGPVSSCACVPSSGTRTRRKVRAGNCRAMLASSAQAQLRPQPHLLPPGTKTVSDGYKRSKKKKETSRREITLNTRPFLFEEGSSHRCQHCCLLLLSFPRDILALALPRAPATRITELHPTELLATRARSPNATHVSEASATRFPKPLHTHVASGDATGHSTSPQ